MDSSESEPEVEDTIAGFAFGNVDKNGKLENDTLSDLQLNKLKQIDNVSGVKTIESKINKAIPTESQIAEINLKNLDYEPGKKAPSALDYQGEDEMIDYDESKDLVKRQKKLLTKSFRSGKNATLGEQRAKHYDDFLEKKVEETDIREFYPEFEKGKGLFMQTMLTNPKPMTIYNKYRTAQNRFVGRQPLGVDFMIHDLKPSKDKNGKTSKNGEKLIENPKKKITRADQVPKDLLMQCDSELLKNPLNLEALHDTYADNPANMDQIDPKTNQNPKNQQNQFRRQQSLTSPYGLPSPGLSSPFGQTPGPTFGQSEFPAWRHGPAKLHYDRLGVDAYGRMPDGRMFDYGFKIGDGKVAAMPQGVRDMIYSKNDTTKKPALFEIVDWESEIIFGDDQKEGMKKMNEENGQNFMKPDEKSELTLLETKRRDELRQKQAGWVPKIHEKNAQGTYCGAWTEAGKKVKEAVENLDEDGCYERKQGSLGPHGATTVYPKSMFKLDNLQLSSNDWMKQIIWDPDNIDLPHFDRHLIMQPMEYKVNPNDPNLILERAIEPVRKEDQEEGEGKKSQPSLKERKTRTEKMTRNLLRDIGFYGGKGEPAESDSSSSEEEIQLDPWNFSNDIHYQPVKSKKLVQEDDKKLLILQHSIPCVQLHPMCMPTYLTAQELRNWHRPKLRPNWDPLENPDPTTLQESVRKDNPNESGWSQYHKKIEIVKKVKFKVMNYKLPIVSLNQHISEQRNRRNAETLATGGGGVFFMRGVEDLSMKDGSLFHYEYSEEYPSLLSQSGMCSLLRVFFRKGEASKLPRNLIGEKQSISPSNKKFLGFLSEGEHLHALESRLFRAPAYRHKIPETDFLCIRGRLGYFIRTIDHSFGLGQICPLTEVPGPNSKKATMHIRDFLTVFIYRLFARSKCYGRERPEKKLKKIRMEDIRRAFVDHSESSIRKRLKTCAEFQRTGVDSNWWILKEGFQLYDEDNIQQQVKPEVCCEYYSMLAAQQRLKDQGYGEKAGIFAEIDEEMDPDTKDELDVEALSAPWNTTKAYLQHIDGKCLLQITGAADPTGSHLGFSYVRVPNKPTQAQITRMQEQQLAQGENRVIGMGGEIKINLTNKDGEENKELKDALVTGTEADLRRLHLSDAKKILKQHGVPDEKIKTLKRWDVIDVVRQIATAVNKEKRGDQTIRNFSRGNIYSMEEHKRQNQQEAQERFDNQNHQLQQDDFISTDEGSGSDTSDEDADPFDEILANALEAGVRKTTKGGAEPVKDKDMCSEEKEKNKLVQQMMMKKGEEMLEKQKADHKEQMRLAGKTGNIVQRSKRMVIIRKVKDRHGNITETRQVVEKQETIDFYNRIKNTMNKDQINNYLTQDPEAREEFKKERRRIQEQLRRIRKNQTKKSQAEANGAILPSVPRSRNSLFPNGQNNNIGRNGQNMGPNGQHMNQNGQNIQNNQFNQLQKQPKPRTHKNSNSTTNSSTPGSTSSPQIAPKIAGPPFGHKVVCSACGANGHMRNNKTCPEYVKAHPEYAAELERKRLVKQVHEARKMEQRNRKLQKEQQQKEKDKRDALMAQQNSNLVSNLGDGKLTLNTGKLGLNIQKKRKTEVLDGFGGYQQMVDSQGRLINQNMHGMQAGMGNTVAQGNMRGNLGHFGGQNQNFGNQGNYNPNQQFNRMNSSDSNQSQSRPKLKIKMPLPQIQAERNSTPPLIAPIKLQLPKSMSVTEKTPPKPVKHLQKYKIKSQNSQDGQHELNSQLSTQSSHNADGTPKKRKSSKAFVETDYRDRPYLKKHDRKRMDPKVALASMLEDILLATKKIELSDAFHFPVDTKTYLDYQKFITSPVDLETMRSKIRANCYSSRAEFREDYSLILKNCSTYNGPNHPLYQVAEQMLETVDNYFAANADRITKLEREINPLFVENPSLRLNKFFSTIIDQLCEVNGSWPFHKPVDPKVIPNYHTVIENPSDLESMKHKCEREEFKSSEQFITDVNLIYNNSARYNGLENQFTKTALGLVELARVLIGEKEEDVRETEKTLAREKELLEGGGDGIENDLDLSDDSDDLNETVTENQQTGVSFEIPMIDDAFDQGVINNSQVLNSTALNSSVMNSSMINSNQIQPGSDLMSDIMGADSLGADSMGNVMTMDDAARGLELEQNDTATDIGLNLSDDDEDDEEENGNNISMF